MGDAIDLHSTGLWLKQAVGHDVTGTLNRTDAEALTAKIKAYAGVTWVLIAAAHEHKAHKALGYKTWAEYVEAEFDMSRSRSYQLISQAKVVLEISEVVSTTVDISEREARDLAGQLDEAKAAATAAVDSLPDDASDADKSAAVNAALDALRPTSETPPPGVDPVTGEIAEGGAGEGAGDDETASPPAPPSVPHQTFVTCPTCGGAGEIEPKETAA